MTRTMMCVVAAALIAGCGDNLSSESQEVSGPTSVTVTPRAAADQLAVSWSAMSGASSYRVLQSANGGAFSLAATIFGSSGEAPATSWIATGLSVGTRYCYTVGAVFPGGSESDPSAPSCAPGSVGPTISPPALVAGNTNNWQPSGFGTATHVLITTGSGSPFLTGLAGGVDGRTVVLTLASMVDPLTITRLDGSSAAGNQLLLPLPAGAVYLQMTAVDQSVTLLYDGVAAKWRVVAKNF